MKNKIAITGFGSISPLGSSQASIWQEYLSKNHLLKGNPIVGRLSNSSILEIDELKNTNKQYSRLDPTVLYAMYAAQKAIKQAGWSNLDFGINIGSSRGATHLMEQYIGQFNAGNPISPLTSPTTTLGNISSWVAQDLGANGPTISHSITCSSASHSFLNAIAWMQAGLSDRFLVGGSEAPLTDFTISQMQALKIYTDGNGVYPCQSLTSGLTGNTMCLGEGAAVFCLDKNPEKKPLSYIEGFGYATEQITNGTSISRNGDALTKAMQMALKDVDLAEVDVVIAHAPGTIKGDASEKEALKTVFGDKMPFLTSNKWKIGHSLGASSALSMEMALLMMQYNKPIHVPYLPIQTKPKQVNKVLVNAIGFGGNAVSLLVSK